MKYYHASPHRFKKGDLIGNHHRPVFMTQEPLPHYTIHTAAVIDNWFIYQVRPLYKVYIGTVWDEAITVMAEVVKVLGRARGINNNRKKHWKDKPEGWKGWCKGGQVYWKRHHNLPGNHSRR